MSEIELVYDRLIAQERLKEGTKYERLAAMVFFLLLRETVVQDLRLRGESGVLHQIDVVVVDPRGSKRILIECKDYEEKVGLDLVMKFFGQVEDLKPDEAFIVTTEGFTGPALKYANAKGIRPALLRTPRPEDLDGLVQRIVLTLRAFGGGDPSVTWRLDQAGFDQMHDAGIAGGPVPIDDVRVREASGPERSFREVWEEIYRTIPMEQGEHSGQQRYEAAASVRLLADAPWLLTDGFDWSVEMHVAETVSEFGIDVGGLVAELAFATLDGRIRRIVTNHQVEGLGFDSDGRVIEKRLGDAG